MSYYKGINTEKGKRVEEEDAFAYAIDHIRRDEDLFEEFSQNFNSRFFFGSLSSFEAFNTFAKDVEDWYFSGNWLFRYE